MRLGLLYYHPRRDKYDIAISKRIFQDILYLLITLLALDIHLMLGMVTKYTQMWETIYIISSLLVFFIDITLPTILHNTSVMDYRKRKKMAQRKEEEVQGETKRSNKE